MAFLAFEGIDASGKSALLKILSEKLREEGLNVVRTKEPGGTQIGSKIREILLDRQNSSFDPLSEVLLYYADRKQNIEELIKPALEKNFWLLADRYWASSSAYQCGGRGVDEGFVQLLRQSICCGCEPDLWILLDLPVEEAGKRLFISKRDKQDRLELENSLFHQRVRDYYLELSRKEPEKWLVLDSSQSPARLLDQTLSHLRQKGLIKF